MLVGCNLSGVICQAHHVICDFVYSIFVFVGKSSWCSFLISSECNQLCFFVFFGTCYCKTDCGRPNTNLLLQENMAHWSQNDAVCLTSHTIHRGYTAASQTHTHFSCISEMNPAHLVSTLSYYMVFVY